MPLRSVYAVPHPPLLIPEIGLGEERDIRDTAESMEIVGREIGQMAPDTIIMISPHAQHMSDRFVLSAVRNLYGDMRRFHSPSIALTKEVDIELSTKIYAQALKKAVPVLLCEEDDLFIDHGSLVPLYFVEKHHKEYKLVLISLSDRSEEEHFSLGRCIASAAASSGKNVVLIASGDLSHRLKIDGPYGFADEGPIFDRKITELMRSNKTDEIRNIDPDIAGPAGECGLRSLIIMSGAISGGGFSSRFMSYEGPFGVGYAVCGFYSQEDDPNDGKTRIGHQDAGTDSIQSDPYVALARKTLEEYIRSGQVIDIPTSLPDEMYGTKAGVFVSLKIQGQLRGCIGTISPVTGSVAEEIVRNAIESGTGDPRFEPVGIAELPLLEYSVDVLGLPEPVKDKSELDPIRYGVIVTHRGRRGLLLPNLEGVDTIDFQLSIALSKAGISSSADYTIERFEVIRHK